MRKPAIRAGFFFGNAASMLRVKLRGVIAVKTHQSIISDCVYRGASSFSSRYFCRGFPIILCRHHRI
jgi:hypothetical protein